MKLRSKRSGSRSSSKGNIAVDIIFVLSFFLVMAIVGFFVYNVLSEFNDEIQSQDSFNNESKQLVQNQTDKYPGLWDNAFIFAVFFLWAGLIISSFLIDTNPIFFAITLVLLIFVFVAAMMFSNNYQELTADTTISSYADDFPKMNFVFENLLIITIVMALTTMLSLYAKTR